MSAPTPVFIEKAFAWNAGGSFRNTIPLAPLTTQRASLNLGFPPLTMTPVAAGGKPMLGPDMNGILYMLSTHTVYQQSGQPYLYSAAVSTAIGGYAIGTLLGSTDGLTLWYNVLAANTSDPDAGGAGWIALFSYGITPVNTLTGGVRTLTPAEASKNVIVFSGALVANQQVVLPTQLRRWLIVNTTTGAFSTTVKTASGTGIVIPQGGYNAPVEVWGDGANIYNVVAPVSLPIDQNATPLTIAQRTNAGYLLAVYFNQSSALENFAVSAVFAQTGADGYFRKISPANLAAQMALSQFSGQVTNAQVPQSAVTQHTAAVLASAALTGTPTAPTPAVGDNSALVATTAFVRAAIASSGFKFVAGRVVGGILQAGSIGGVLVSHVGTGVYNLDLSAAGFTTVPICVATDRTNQLNTPESCAINITSTTFGQVTNNVQGIGPADGDFQFFGIGL